MPLSVSGVRPSFRSTTSPTPSSTRRIMRSGTMVSRRLFGVCPCSSAMRLYVRLPGQTVQERFAAHQNTLILRALSRRFVQNDSARNRHVQTFDRALHGDAHRNVGQGEFVRQKSNGFSPNKQRTRSSPIYLAENGIG